MKLFFLKLWSRITGKPIEIGYSFTCDPERSEKEQILHAPKNLIFFKLREDLGFFEISEVRHGKKGEVKYKLSHPNSDQELIVPQKWFDFLFEETHVDHTPYYFSSKEGKTK